MNSVGELPALTRADLGKRVTQDRGDTGTTAQYLMLIADCSAEQGQVAWAPRQTSAHGPADRLHLSKDKGGCGVCAHMHACRYPSGAGPSCPASFHLVPPPPVKTTTASENL